MSGAPIIGVDVGGTTIKSALVSEDGEILDRDVRETRAHDGPEAVLNEITASVRELHSRIDAISGVGVGVPGMVDLQGNVQSPPNFPGWDSVHVENELRSRLGSGWRIAVDNDANVAALAESNSGAGRDIKSFLYVTLGTGIGGCIVSDGEIYRGATGGAGEVGHVTVDLNGPICNCGARGCVEAYIGQRYMTEYARQKMRRYRESMLHELMEKGEELTPRLINEAAEGGDIFAQNFLTEMGRILGAALASVLNATDLHVVIVGGGISQAETFLLGQARRTLRARVLQPIANDVQLRVAGLGLDAGVIGAASLLIGRNTPSSSETNN